MQTLGPCLLRRKEATRDQGTRLAQPQTDVRSPRRSYPDRSTHSRRMEARMTITDRLPDSDQAATTTTIRERWPWGGALFAVMFPVSLVLGTSPDIHSSSQTTIDYYTAGADKFKSMAAWGVAAFSVVALIWFVAGLTARLRARGCDHQQARLVTLSAGLVVATATIASAVKAAPAGDLLMDNENRAGQFGKLTPTFVDFARITSSLYDWILFFGLGLGAAALVLTVTLADRRARVLPRWLRTLGYPAAPILAVLAWFNVVLFLLWVGAVSAAVLRGHRERPAAATTRDSSPATAASGSALEASRRSRPTV